MDGKCGRHHRRSGLRGMCFRAEGYTLPREEEFKKLLDVPKDRRLLTLVPIGVPVGWPTVEKKPLKEVLHWEKFGSVSRSNT